MLTLYSVNQLFPYPTQTSAYAVTGYVMLVPGTGQVDARYLNDRIKAEYMLDFGAVKVPQPASRRPLVVDAVVSSGTNFAQVTGGLPNNVSNHMSGSLPMGAHTGFVDGSVKWRAFKQGVPTNFNDFSQRTTSGSPSFWF